MEVAKRVKQSPEDPWYNICIHSGGVCNWDVFTAIGMHRRPSNIATDLVATQGLYENYQ